MTRARISLAIAVVATLALLVPLAVMWNNSRLPDSYDMAAMGYPDYGGGPHRASTGEGMDHSGGAGQGTPVKDLVADPERPADVETTLTVHQDGDRFTVNGESPGPTIDATVGDLVQVTLVNDDVEEGTTLHWHGVDVPNAMDGVAGVTQDAVPVGGTFTYRFVVERVGTYWYHSHQVSHTQVLRGLYGPLVVHPKRADDRFDVLAVTHTGATPLLVLTTRSRTWSPGATSFVLTVPVSPLTVESPAYSCRTASWSTTAGSGPFGCTTSAPNSPPCTWECETWWEWYQ